MKKIFFSLAVAAVATIAGNQSFAQTKTARVGLTAGVNLTTLGTASSGGVSIDYKYRPGFQGGIFVEVPVAKKISFAPQLIFSQKGGDINTVISGVTFKGSTKINYLDLPLLFDFKIDPAFSVFVGPQVAFFMSQSTNVTASLGSNSSSDTNSSGEGFRKTLVGANFGLGYKINSDFGLKLHYVTDFQHAGENGNDTGERNSGFALTAGFLF